MCNSAAPVLCGYLPVSIEFLLGLHELVVKYAFLKINPFFANASIFGVTTSLFP